MNVPIRVFNTDLELLGEVDDYLQASFTRRWHSPGEFEIFINSYSPSAQLLRKNNIIMFGDDVSRTGIIKHREIGLTQEGKTSENWVIQGVSLGGITKQRITIPESGQAYLSFSGAIETIMKGLVDKNLISVPTIRKIAILDLEEDSLRGESISYQSRYKNLAEDLEALSVLSGLGWEIVPDFSTKRLTFKVSVGVNRVYGQTTNPPVIFSPEFDAIKEQRFRDSDLGLKNSIYVGGQGEGADRIIYNLLDVDVDEFLYEDNLATGTHTGTFWDGNTLKMANRPVLETYGNNHQVRLGTAQYLPNNHPFTWMGWVYYRATTSRMMLVSRHNAYYNSQPYAYLLGFRDGSIAAYDGAAWRDGVYGYPPINTWMHLAFSYDGSTMRFYINGEAKGSVAFTFSDATTYVTAIGGYNTTSGDVDGRQVDIRFFDKELSQAEIQTEMYGNAIPTKGWWRADEGVGTTINDVSGNGNHGITYGNVAWTNPYYGFPLLPQGYVYRVSPPVDISHVKDSVSSTFNVTQNMPVDTLIKNYVGYGTDLNTLPSVWNIVDDLGSLTGLESWIREERKYIWLRQELSTSNPAITPDVSTASAYIKVRNESTYNSLVLSEHFQDARDLETTQELITRGQQKLQEFNTEKVFEATINEFGPFKYRQDWDLGDLVTIQNKAWDETMDARIISVTEAFTPEGETISVGLGNQYPNLIAQLKKKFDNFDNEIRR